MGKGLTIIPRHGHFIMSLYFIEPLLRRTGMNLEKHLNVRFVHQSEKLKPNNLIKSYSELEGEFATPYLQVTSRKRSVTDCIPSKFILY